MAHESRPPHREGGEANPKNAIEAEGFAQNPQELEEMRQALAREEEKAPEEQAPPGAEDKRGYLHGSLDLINRFRELARQTIKELSHDGALPTEQEVKADISRLLKNRHLSPEELGVIHSIYADSRLDAAASASKNLSRAQETARPVPEELRQTLERRYRELLFRAEDPKLVRALMLAYKAGQETNDTAFHDILQGMGNAEINNLALAFQAGEAISGQYRTAEQHYVTLLMQSAGVDTRRLMEANKAGRIGDHTALETLLHGAENPENAYRLYVAFQAGEESAGRTPDARKSETQTVSPPPRGSQETPEATSDDTPEINVIHTVETQNETADTPEEAAERRQQEAAKGITESAESISETLTPQERLTRLQAESPDIHPDVLGRAFRRGATGDQNAVQGFFREFGDRFDADQKSKIIDAYNIGAEMNGHPLFAPESSPETTEELPDNAEREEEEPAQERRRREPTEEERQEEQKRQEEDERRAEEERERQRAEEEEDFNFLDKKTREVLFGRLAHMRQAYAEAELRVDKVKGDATAEIMEAERARSAYRGAINAIRDYYQRHTAADTLLSPEQKAQKMQEIILETTAREANRLFDLKTDIKSKEREEATKERIANIETKSSFGKLLSVSAEGAREAGRMALQTAEAYRNLPIKYKLLLSGVLAGGSITAGALALPTLAIGLGLGVSIQRILGGGAAAISIETGLHKRQEKKSEKEVAREIERQGDMLTALLRADNQERLNDLMFEQAGRKGWERNKRMALAGVTFAAIATGLPGAGIRAGTTYLAQSETAHTVMNFLGIPDNLKDRVAENAPNKQNLRPSANAPFETKPNTAPNEPPPQQTQPAQPTKKEIWIAAERKWVPAEPVVAQPPAVPAGEGRNPYAPPAEGAKTAAPRAATAEAPPKTQVAAEKQPLQTTRPEATTSKTAAEVAARARAIEMTTVRKGEGAWQAVRRQFYERMRTEPQKFGMAPDEAAKLPPDLEKLGKGTHAAKILNRETLATLKKAGWINPDGTTKVGIAKPGVRVFLTPENSIELQGEGKLKYEPSGQRPKGGTTPDRTGRPRSGAAAESSGRARTRGALPQERGAVRQSFDLNKEPSLPELKARLEDIDSYGGRAAADKVQAANLKEFGLKPQELKNISEMKVKAFIDEMDRHDTEIREAVRGRLRGNESIFINKGQFTTRGFSADITEARKYLDLSERLEKYIKSLDKASRQAILKEPMGTLLRAFSFEK